MSSLFSSSSSTDEECLCCDYLVIGGGATGMSFVDTLLNHYNNNEDPIKVIMIDKHNKPGGQWHDSYNFVQLHQPSSMYGVESIKLEPTEGDVEHHRATRQEILEYYENVGKTLTLKYDFQFIGQTMFDFSQLNKNNKVGDDDCGGNVYTINNCSTKESKEESGDGGSTKNIRVLKKVVDARFLEPDIPIFMPPKFKYDSNTIRCVPVNSIVDPKIQQKTKYYVVIGAGKTGMDCITYLLRKEDVDPNNILWICPNEPWITARENIGSCMEFLHTCVSIVKRKQQDETKTASIEELVKSQDFFQDGFLEWEKQGKIYRLFNDNDNDSSMLLLPTKFKDATLDKQELSLINQVSGGQVIRNKGRVKSIENNGDLIMEDDTSLALPWGSSVSDTTYIHCSAGAFNYQKQPNKTPPIFDDDNRIITIQDVYGTPGFCFVGSIVGMMECLNLTNEQKNNMLLAPMKNGIDDEVVEEPSLLGPSGGDVGSISSDHGYVQRLTNLRKWLQNDEICSFLEGHRLFNLASSDKYSTTKQMKDMVDETWEVLKESHIVI